MGVKPAPPRAPLDVDDRIGSREFLRPLLKLGVPARSRRLGFADFAFLGHGPHGRVRVGIERKTVSEIFGAITDSRFIGHQLPGLLLTYDYVFLVVEGPARVDPRSGLLMLGHREAGYSRVRTMYATYRKFLTTLAVKGRVFVEPTYGFTETLWLVGQVVYPWFQAPWASHQSAYHIEESQTDRAIFSRRTRAHMVANQLPGISWVRAGAVADYFPSIEDMTAATVTEWQKALGIAKGRAVAVKLNQTCRRKERWG